jgi:hypothetical protein
VQKLHFITRESSVVGDCQNCALVQSTILIKLQERL